MKKLTKEQVIEGFKTIHGDRYDYSKFNYVNSKTRGVIICSIHGEFEQRPYNHGKGEGCPACGKLVGRARKTTEEFIKEAKLIHGDTYNYDKTKYIEAHSTLIITCPIHGEFEQIANQHLKGAGCVKCSYIKRGEDRKLDTELISKNIKSKLEAYGYHTTDLLPNDVENKFNVICPKHGGFLTNYRQLVYLDNRCPKCSGVVSRMETELNDFLKSRNIITDTNNRTVLGGREIDIFIPQNKIGIEMNGLIWHSTKFGKGSRYHLDKTIDASKVDVELIHIFEDEFFNRKEVVKSLILNKCGKSDFNIYARKCEVSEITNKEAYKFCESNHLKGGINSSINIGLFFNKQLVAVLTFSKLRKVLGSTHKEGSYELLRLCSKNYTRVVGGASKMLKFFETKYKPLQIISYSDKRYSIGRVYEKLGFEYVSTSSPNYFYIKSNGVRLHRFKFTKDKLISQGEDANLSERKIMEKNGYFRIYDCGADKFIKTY